MKNFIKFIAIIFVLSNASAAMAITVFDTPSHTEEKENITPAIKKDEPKKTAAVKENHKKGSAKKSTVKKTSPKKAPVKKEEAKKPIAKKNAPKNTPAAIPQKKAESPADKAAVNLNTPKTESPAIVAKSALPPLIIVNNFEEDPIFITAVKGVLYGINKNLDIVDISKNTESKLPISQAYKLLKASRFWGENTVFVSGSFKDQIEISIIVAKSKNNQFFITQNSGILTFIEDTVGLAEVREIQRVNFDSKTFSGRDVEYLVGAKLIDNPNSFNTMGEPMPLEKLAKFNYTPLSFSNNTVSSTFVVEDKENGDIFTFIPADIFNKFNPKENDMFRITLSNGANIISDFEAIYKNSLTYSGGNQAIILSYKSSIGSFIIIKNAKEPLPSIASNNKIIISPLGNSAPLDISSTVNTDSDDNEFNNIYPYGNNSNAASTTVREQNTEESAAPTQSTPSDAPQTTNNIYPHMNNEDTSSIEDKENTRETSGANPYVRTW
ncbi:MAG: SAM-dependent chlorinase/fluorinase [Alphaproteobacteria bacterium]|nr:SAM-dependent chlorinase/fluorinase [Alphaproteobacteria bacterium]